MKKLLIGCTGLIVVLIIAGVIAIMMLPSDYELERSKVISATPAEVYAVVGDLHSWPEWTAWSKEADPECIWNYNGKSGVGAGVDWTGPVHGEGEMTITGLEENSKIEYALTFKEGEDEMVSNGRFELTPSGSGTSVRWVMFGELEGVGKLFGPVMDSMVGPDFEAGLNNLETRFNSAKK